MTPDDLQMLASRMVGRSVTGVRRIFYEHQGSIDPTNGALELTLSDEATFLFDVASDGESLKVSYEPWQDPFTYPLSPENEAYVRESGKWTAVHAETGIEQVMGAQIEGCRLVNNAAKKVVGIQLLTTQADISARVEFDEFYVNVQPRESGL